MAANRTDVLGLVAAYLRDGDDAARLLLADCLEEAGDQETAGLLRDGRTRYVVTGDHVVREAGLVAIHAVTLFSRPEVAAFDWLFSRACDCLGWFYTEAAANEWAGIEDEEEEDTEGDSDA